MNKRIKTIRNSANESQEVFASKLQLSRNFVWMMEKGEREPSDRTIRDICNVYNVNEVWLRTGEGDMLQPLDRESEIALIMSKLVDNPIYTRIVKALSEASEEELKMIVDLAERIANEQE